MYVIAGATGRVGSEVARRMRQHGAEVSAVSRSGANHTQKLDLSDNEALTAALRGADGFFVLLPFGETLAAPGRGRELLNSIGSAVAASGVPHVVALSSGGADLPSGTGPIVELHHLEQRLLDTGAAVTALRSCHFQEKISDVLPVVREHGVFPVFASTATRPVPMVATRDVGEFAARALLDPPADSEAVDVLGPPSTEQQVAASIGRALGRHVEAVVISRESWESELQAAGLPYSAAQQIAEMYRADDAGLLAPRAPRSVTGTTPLDVTVAEVVGRG